MRQPRRKSSTGSKSRDDRRPDDASRNQAHELENAFVTFTESSGEADERAYAKL